MMRMPVHIFLLYGALMFAFGSISGAAIHALITQP